MQQVKSYLLILLIVLVSSCSIFHRIPQKEYIHDTTTVYKNTNTVLHDSIYVWKDHIIYEKGDTVYDKTIEYKDRWRIKEVHDTLYKDKVKYEYKEIPVEVEKPLTGIQKIFIALGKVLVVILFAAIACLVGYVGIKLRSR